MLSAKLVVLIEDHWQGITAAIIHHLRTDPKLHHIRALPDSELHEVGRIILRNLGQWLTASKGDQELINEQYEGIGRLRFAERIPLQECVRGLQVVKRKVIEYMRDHALAESSVDIYAEEELEHRLNDFFDDLIYHEVVGYEGAMTKGTAMSA
jgi:hypothetical protein